LHTSKSCGLYKVTPTISNCVLEKLQDTTCRACEDGYSLADNYTKCENFANCYLMKSNECSFCNDYYYLKDGKCVLDYCQMHGSGQSCLTCEPGFNLTKMIVEGTTVEIETCLFINTTDNCAELDENSKCTKCMTGFKLENNECVLESDIEGCLESNTDGTCKKCDIAYDLKNGKCSFNCKGSTYYEVCLACEKGYYIDTHTNRCKRLDGKEEDDDDDMVIENDDDSASKGINININFALIYLLLALI
jgi:hypothetical protein